MKQIFRGLKRLLLPLGRNRKRLLHFVRSDGNTEMVRSWLLMQLRMRLRLLHFVRSDERSVVRKRLLHFVRSDEQSVVRKRLLHFVRNDVFTIIYCVLFSCASFAGVRAAVIPAGGQGTAGSCALLSDTIVPLYMGDTIPDSLWKHKMPIYLDSLGRDSVCLADFRADDKVLIIDFWPTWCSPCVKSVLHLDSLTKMRSYRNIQFLSIHVIETKARLQKFIDRTGFKISTMHDFSFLANRLLTRYAGYYGLLMIKGDKILGAPDKRTLTLDNLDRIESGKWDELTIKYWPPLKKIVTAAENLNLD